ncbi:methionine-tRNA synthetase [Coprinopsis marcescibilis]|uniref:Methionine--tRNA ligase, mitochondrial n=1 Tax=Coprinopsis marcescibilis TaxID=230819 RepID=A0A5C3KVX6_COPMA|nr:methionine-tRNA synthetase [Coprinopsis marcescibilis]
MFNLFLRHRCPRCPASWGTHRGTQLSVRLERWTRTYSSESDLTRSQDTKKPYYITTPIFYPNAVPHIGHLYTLVLGDIFARYQRLQDPGRPVKLLVGTDEHGMKIQQAAAKARGCSEQAEVLAFCDELSEVFQNLSKKANISYTVYARTTRQEHRNAVEHVWRNLWEKGFIYKGDYEGWYSITDECFYTTTQVTESALSTPETPEYISKETGSKVEWSKEYNYMFRLSAFRDALLQHYSTNKPSDAIVTPSQYNSVALQMLAAGETQVSGEPPLLADISISRPRSRLNWGIPVPNDPEHTVYVWFDALLIYLSGVGYPGLQAKDNSGWAPNLQIIGKDILRFHSLYLPAILMALGAPKYAEFGTQTASETIANSYPLPHRLLTHAHWTVSHQKMSKSVGNVVDPVHSLEKYGIDIVRFYLARVGGRFRDDVDWSFEQLEKHSKELQSYLGNYFLRNTSARLTANAELGYQEVGHQHATSHPSNVELSRRVYELPTVVKTFMDNLEIAEAVGEMIEVLGLANKAITDIAPWSKTCSPVLVYETRRTALDTLRTAGICLRPFVPETSERLLDALALPQEERTWESLSKNVPWHERKVQGVRLF